MNFQADNEPHYKFIYHHGPEHGGGPEPQSESVDTGKMDTAPMSKENIENTHVQTTFKDPSSGKEYSISIPVQMLPHQMTQQADPTNDRAFQKWAIASIIEDLLTPGKNGKSKAHEHPEADQIFLAKLEPRVRQAMQAGGGSTPDQVSNNSLAAEFLQQALQEGMSSTETGEVLTSQVKEFVERNNILSFQEFVSQMRQENQEPFQAVFPNMRASDFSKGRILRDMDLTLRDFDKAVPQLKVMDSAHISELLPKEVQGFSSGNDTFHRNRMGVFENKEGRPIHHSNLKSITIQETA